MTGRREKNLFELSLNGNIDELRKHIKRTEQDKDYYQALSRDHSFTGLSEVDVNVSWQNEFCPSRDY